MNAEQLFRENVQLKKDNEQLREDNLMLVRDLEEQHSIIMWCGGSDDFSVGGKARAGWEKVMLIIEKNDKKIKKLKEDKKYWNIR